MSDPRSTSRTGLVKRLRDMAAAEGIYPKEVRLAADEIERLTAALKEIADMRYDNTSAATMACRALEGKE
jgi:hypothetical protein